MSYDLVKVGQTCRELRKNKNITQIQVGNKIGYSPENISSFECGRNDNLNIFLWYLENCFTLSEGLKLFIKEIKKHEYK